MKKRPQEKRTVVGNKYEKGNKEKHDHRSEMKRGKGQRKRIIVAKRD